MSNKATMGNVYKVLAAAHKYIARRFSKHADGIDPLHVVGFQTDHERLGIRTYSRNQALVLLCLLVLYCSERGWLNFDDVE